MKDLADKVSPTWPWNLVLCSHALKSLRNPRFRQYRAAASPALRCRADLAVNIDQVRLFALDDFQRCWIG